MTNSWKYVYAGVPKILEMSSIEVCCDGMKTMIKDGAIHAFTTWGQNTGEIRVVGSSWEIRTYNLINYCPFCGRPIRIIKEASPT
jgi:hypothetical protein